MKGLMLLGLVWWAAIVVAVGEADPFADAVLVQRSYLKRDFPRRGDYFGSAVASSGKTLVVGVPRGDRNEGDNAGRAYVFVESGSKWVQQASVSLGQACSQFGVSVSISEDTMVVGAANDDSEDACADDDGAGAAYVFTRRDGIWEFDARLQATDRHAEDQFGRSVAIYGDTIIVGAHREGAGEEPSNLPYSGAAYIFERTTLGWVEQARLKASNYGQADSFGAAVALGDGTAVVGAPKEAGDGSSEDDNSAITAGAAYVFGKQGEQWIQEAYLKASNAGANDNSAALWQSQVKRS